MKAVIQRVSRAAVAVDGATVGRISTGLLVLLAVEKGDHPGDGEYLARKIVNLRVFADEQGNMNRSLSEVGGQLLVISQFTLAGSTRKGRRPSFDRAAAGPEAEALYEDFARQARKLGIAVETGRFGAMMQVELVNDGPVTFLVESRKTGSS